MATKSTIFKAIIQNSSRGFTLLELLVGLVIMGLISGLALNAFIGASNDFNKDKRSIDSSQNLSAVLEMIGNDIKESGEKISDSNFPTIEFILATASDPLLMLGSSKVIIRRAVSDPLTLCQTIATGTAPSSLATLVVADNTPGPGGVMANSAGAACNVGSQTTQLQAARPSANLVNSTYQLVTGTLTPLPPTLTPSTAIPSPALSPILPIPLRKARDYRCTLDEPNPATPYDAPTMATTDFCGGTGEIVRIAVSDKNGHILVFNQIAEVDNSAGTVARYSITVNTSGLDAPTIASNTRNQAVGYPIGSPIYLIEERAYTLTANGDLQLSVNGEPPTTLVKRIAKFRVSAKGYMDASNNRIVNPTPPVPADICVTPPAPTTLAPTPTTPTVDDPQYICKLNYNTAVGDPPMNWKWTAGVRVELQYQYDSAGRAADTTVNAQERLQINKDKEKSAAAAEFFPRNVLSK